MAQKQPNPMPPVSNGANTDYRQVGGDHYCQQEIQPWHAMKSWLTAEAFNGFLSGNVIKYMARWRQKNGIEDLKKARHYLDKLIEEVEAL